jgi:cytochrome c nitrite reductase small subunit
MSFSSLGQHSHRRDILCGEFCLMSTGFKNRRIGNRGNFAVACLVVATGAIAGLGGYTFIYAKGASYLHIDPAVCANCHIVQNHFDAWAKSSHHTVAVCNDCHTPHFFVAKYFTKSLNGFNHSLAFTTGNFHEPIQITERNRRIVEKACRYCHGDIVQMIDLMPTSGMEMNCIRCHAAVGHAQ